MGKDLCLFIHILEGSVMPPLVHQDGCILMRCVPRRNPDSSLDDRKVKTDLSSTVPLGWEPR